MASNRIRFFSVATGHHMLHRYATLFPIIEGVIIPVQVCYFCSRLLHPFFILQAVISVQVCYFYCLFTLFPRD